jgi:hypothetical protein
VLLLGQLRVADPPDSQLAPLFLSNLSQVSSVGSARLCMGVLLMVVELHHRSRSPRGASPNVLSLPVTQGLTILPKTHITEVLVFLSDL